MAHFHVTIQRTEEITFEIDADDQEEATAHYLMEGDEIASKTIRTVVIDTEELRL